MYFNAKYHWIIKNIRVIHKSGAARKSKKSAGYDGENESKGDVAVLVFEWGGGGCLNLVLEL